MPTSIANRLAAARTGIRLALRSAARRPAHASLVCCILGLGIGASTALFGVVNSALLRPLPFPSSERLVLVWGTNPDRSVVRFGVSYADFLDWKARAKSFSDMALFRGERGTMVSDAGSESLAGLVVTRNFFDVLGTKALAGRLFDSTDEPGESSNAVVLSYGFWQRRFGGNRAVIGESLPINGRTRTIIGVLPPEAQVLGPGLTGSPLDVVTVVETSRYPLIERHAQHLFVAVARLKTNVSLETSRADIAGVAKQVAVEHPEIAGWTASVFPLSEELTTDVRNSLTWLLGASLLVLIIACANVAGLALVRSVERQHEFAIRQALGASHGAIVWQLVTESLVLSVAGGLLGLGIAATTLMATRRLLPDGVLARRDDVRLDAPAVVFAFLMVLFASLVVGLWSAFRSNRESLGSTLREGQRGGGSKRTSRARNSLVAAQFGAAFVLVSSCALLAQSIRRMIHTNAGFDADHAVAATVTLGREYPDSSGVQFYRRVMSELESHPDVIAAGATDRLPLAGPGGVYTSIRLVGADARPKDRPLMSAVRLVTPGFFHAMGMRIIDGADIDWNEPAPTVTLSEAARRSFWPDGRAIGRLLGFNVQPNDLRCVGVVSDVRQVDLRTPAAPVVYVSLRQFINVVRSMTVVVRGRGSAATLRAELRDAVRTVDPRIAVYDEIDLDEIVTRSVQQPRMEAVILVAFALISVALAGLGLYGLLAYAVACRARELAIRLALGASTTRLVAGVVRDGLTLAALGVLGGLAANTLLARALRASLYGVDEHSPAIVLGVAGSFLCLATFASVVPALRVLRISPVAAMSGGART